MKDIKFIEVCAGCGGLSQGLIDAGLKPVLLNDIDKNCCETLIKNHEKVKVIKGKMEELDFSKYKNKIDILAGGVPCQSFSQAGKRKGLEDKRGDLIMQFSNLVDTIKPKIFLIENVRGLITHKKGETLKKVIDKLNKSKNYNVVYQLLNAVDYEVPQKRERIFIVGIKKDIKKEFEFPIKIKNKVLLKDVLKDVPKSECAKYSEEKKKYFKLIPAGGCWVNLPEKMQKIYLGKSYESGGGKRGILRKLSYNEPSLTLLCSPTQKQTERCHPTEIRPLSVREYARIQTFPDTYEFSGSVSSKYKQIGNAVPVKLAKQIGLKLLDIFE